MLSSGCARNDSGLYTIGLFQFSSNVALDESREGFLKALGEGRKKGAPPKTGQEDLF